MKSKLSNLIPAPSGWKAVFVEKTGDGDKDWCLLHLEPVVALCLTSLEGETYVDAIASSDLSIVGLSDTFVSTMEHEHFACYQKPGQDEEVVLRHAIEAFLIKNSSVKESGEPLDVEVAENGQIKKWLRVIFTGKGKWSVQEIEK